MDGIAERIIKTMKSEGVTYTELAQKTGISKSALQRYATGTTGKIPLDRIELIARHLNVTPEYLLGWSEQEAIYSDAPINSIYRQFKYVTDEISSLARMELPTEGVDTRKTVAAIDKVMEINDVLLHTPRLSLAFDIEEAIIGLKFILCYLQLDWRKYDDDPFAKIINSDLFKDILKDLLKLYCPQSPTDISTIPSTGAPIPETADEFPESK